MPKMVMGIDPGLSGTGWELIDIDGMEHMRGGTIHHGIPGRGQWLLKSDRIADEMHGIMLGALIVKIIVEEPPFGSRGRNQAASVALQATTRLAWMIYSKACHCAIEGATMLMADRRTKAQRSQHLQSIIKDFPKRTSEHQRDAAWVALRR